MSGQIINLDDLEFQDFGHGERFEAKIGHIGSRIGARDLGYNLTVLPPGKRAFPIHSHRVNEEMFYIIQGEGEIRIGKERHPVRAGDVIACPPGGPETAHQIINSAKSGELKFLAVSTSATPEICDYPDSGKYGIYLHKPPADDGTPQSLRFFAKDESSAEDYWAGED